MGSVCGFSKGVWQKFLRWRRRSCHKNSPRILHVLQSSWLISGGTVLLALKLGTSVLDQFLEPLR